MRRVILRDEGGNAAQDGAKDERILGEIVQRANQSLAEYQRMRMWLQWPEEDFPRTSTQKPRKNLIQGVAQNALSRTRLEICKQRNPWASSAPLAELIARVVGRAVPNLKAGANLDSDLGLSSLDRVELLGALEDRYQVDLSETRFSDVRTVGDLDRNAARRVMPRRPRQKAAQKAITIPAGPCAGPPRGCDSWLITYCCARRLFCSAGLESRAAKICAA
jgi:acyl carrier protein